MGVAIASQTTCLYFQAAIRMVKRGYSSISESGARMPATSSKAYKKRHTFRRKVASRFSGLIPEVKFLDTTVGFTLDATNEIPATGQFCIIPQGDGQSEREGRKAVVKSIQFNGKLQLIPGASATSADIACLWVIQDTQANGAAATVANNDTGIFTAAGALATSAVRCLANVDRFKILHKWTVPMYSSAGVTTAYNNVVTSISMYKKCNIPLEYDASVATGALTSIRSNNIFMVAGTGALTDDLIACEGTFRLRFVG